MRTVMEHLTPKVEDYAASFVNVPSKTLFNTPVPKLDPAFVDIQDLLFGLLAGSSFLGNPQCTASMNGVIYYAFQVFTYREVYNPAYTMKAVIAGQKLQEQVGLFYT
jgi:hypothetical protein